MVRCTNGSLYTGIATDVERRIQEHESGMRGAKYLRGRGPLRLEFQQRMGNRRIASQVEYHVKQLDRDQKEELIAGRHSLADLVPELDAGDVQASGEVCG